MTTTTSTPTLQQAAWPLFDLFLDLPHPAASPKCPPHFIIKPPDDRSEIVIKEMGDEAAIARIARFAFPEHDDRAPKPPAPKTGGAGLNRHDVYWIQHKGFASHTFSLQLSDGVRVHGHVRRYLPLHLEAKSRWDVGRRGVRAMVLLSRAAGGDLLFDSVLKSVEGISSQQSATPPDFHPSSSPQSAFLKALHKNHVAICNAHAQKPNDKRAPMVLTLQGAEFGNVPKFLEVDSSRFLLPTSLMQLNNTGISAAVVAPMLPLLRALGVPNALRVMSALLSERRVCMVSASPTRLTNCARSALAMLAQGLLHWQHLFIPVLPPHLIQYLAAPMPYLIGILTNIASQLDQVQEIGEVLIIHLDTNQMETRGMQPTQVLQKIPDLCARTMLEDPNTGYQPTLSASEELARGLTDILKSDKRAMSGDSAFQEGTKEAVKKVGRAFGKLKEKGRAYLQKQSNSTVSEPKTPPNEPNIPDEVDPQEANYIYTESCLNEAAEEEVRISITVFFLCMIGDLRWFLTQQQTGQPPVLDRNKFIQSKRALGDVEGTPIYPLLQNFVQTQMFEQFAKTRVEQVSLKQVPARDAPLFARCAHQHRANRIDFTFNEVRRMARELAQTSPSRFLIQSNATARRLAMSLTSNTAFSGNYQQALTRLTESCREASSVLFDVMSVVWMRLRDSKGMQWKHGLYALHIVRNLILHGPLAAVAEATDGLDKIRLFQTYSDSLRTKQSQQIRDAATQVYKLLVDRAMLFAARRVCANSRRLMKHPPPGRLTRDARLRVTHPFKSIHAAMAPSGHRPAVAPVAPPPPKQPSPTTRAGPQQQAQRQQQQRPQRQQQQQVNPVVDLLGMSPSSEPGHIIQQVNQQSNSVLGMMDQMTVSGAGGDGVPKDPFTTSSNNGGPTYAQIPPKQQQQQQYSQPTFAQIPPQQPPTTAQEPLFAPQQQPKAMATPVPAFAQQPKSAPAAPSAYSQQQPPPPAFSQQPAAAPAFAQQPKPVPAPAPAFAQQPKPAPAFAQQPTYAQIPKTTAPTYAPQQQQPPQRTLAPAVYAQQAPGGYSQPPAYKPQQQQQGAAYPSYPVPQQQQQQQPQQQSPYQQQAPPPAYAPQQQQQAAGAPPQQQQQQYAQPMAPPGTNLFIAAPPAPMTAPQQQQQQQHATPPSNVNKFDPMRRDPFA